MLLYLQSTVTSLSKYAQSVVQTQQVTVKYRCVLTSSHAPRPPTTCSNTCFWSGRPNILCFQAVLATGESLCCTLPKDLHSQLLFRGSGFFVIAPDSSASTVTPFKLPGAELPANNGAKGWTVVYVLADADPPELARQGHWYAALSSAAASYT